MTQLHQCEVERAEEQRQKTQEELQDLTRQKDVRNLVIIVICLQVVHCIKIFDQALLEQLEKIKEELSTTQVHMATALKEKDASKEELKAKYQQK